VTEVRQRVTREHKGLRGRGVDPTWTNRRLLLRAGNTLSPRTLARLQATLRTHDPTDEIGAAWGIKEQLRRLLASNSLADAEEQKMRLGAFVLAADMPEIDRLSATIDAWWEAIEVLIVTGVTNARTEAANTGISRSSAPAAATATPRTTASVSCSSAPPGRQLEHLSQRDRAAGRP
jgi:transposase